MSLYSTGRLQLNIDLAKTNQNKVLWICMNFSEYLRIGKLIRENESMILNL